MTDETRHRSTAAGNADIVPSVEVDQKHAQEAELGPAGVGELQQGLATAAEASRLERQQQLDREAKELDKVAKRHQAALEKATKEAGVDRDGIGRELEQLRGLDDVAQIRDRLEKLNAKHGSSVKKAFDLTKVDRKAERKGLLQYITVPEYARVIEDRTSGGRSAEIAAAGDAEPFVGLAWQTTPEDVPAPATPSGYTEVVLSKPYGIRQTQGAKATADLATGKLYNYNDYWWAGWAQHLAAVGSLVRVEPNIRRVRAEATVDASAYTFAYCGPGYASAEVLLNLKVMDGTQIVASTRLSLTRSIAAVWWVNYSSNVSGQYFLSCEFSPPGGVPRSYAVLVELETWSGAGGASFATSSGTATPAQIRANLST